MTHTRRQAQALARSSWWRRGACLRSTGRGGLGEAHAACPDTLAVRRACSSALPGRAACMASELIPEKRRSAGPHASARPGADPPAAGPLARRGQLRTAPAGPARRLRAAAGSSERPDDRDRRRLQRPRGRSGPAHLRRRILPSRLHRGQRVLQAGQRARRNLGPAVPENDLPTEHGARHQRGARRRSDGLGPRDLARHRDRAGRVPELPHPAGRGELPVGLPSGSGRERGRVARSAGDQQLLGRARAGRDRSG